MEVAVVILNYNGKHFLEQFLPGVIAHSQNAKIIVADNKSTDDSVAFMQNNYPEITTLINDENGGFAKGYNDALKRVKADVYVLLNSDIEVTPNWMEGCLNLLKTDSSIAACQPKIKAFHHKTRFEHAGAAGGFLDKDYFPFCRGRIFEVIEDDHGQYNDDIEIFWATGACLFIRAEIYHELGGLDEAFFAHMEEIDLCWRIKKKGHKIYYSGQNEVYHVGGGTLDYQSPRKVYFNFRNSLFMLVKNHEGVWFPKLFKRMILDGIAAFKLLFGGYFKHFWAVFRAHMALYARLRTLLKQRKAIKAFTIKGNKKGIYQKSIVFDKFLRGVSLFSELNKKYFS